MHQDCRRNHCNPQRINSAQVNVTENISKRRALRSEATPFDYKEHCLFCGQSAKCEGKKKGHDVIPVRAGDFQTRTHELCKRRHDKWAQEVESRLSNTIDLHAADSVYHAICSVNFRTGKNIPQVFSANKPPSKKSGGRPQEETRTTAFRAVVDYIEEHDEEEQITIMGLVSKMDKYLADTGFQAYSAVYMKKRLLEHFKNDIFITEINGKQNVVNLRTTTASIVHNFYSYSKDEDSQANQLRIVQTTGKLIKNDIKHMQAKEEYSTPAEMSDAQENIEYVPESLVHLLRVLLSGKDIDLKLSSLGQALIQASRPRTLMPPLQLGLGVQLRHHFASKFWIQSLNRLGFYCSYAEVQKYERAAAKTLSVDIPGFASGHFVQFVANNVGHNSRTLDGMETFHGMDIIAAVSPGIKTCTPIPRVTVSAEDLAAVGRINIHHFSATDASINDLVYQRLPKVDVEDATSNVDLLWKTSLLLRSPRLCWSGVMQHVQHGMHPEPSTIKFLPMIDMDPSDLTCIYSTLKFVCAQATRLGVMPTSVVESHFDRVKGTTVK